MQPKLTVNAPGDRYEREADAMADRVMRMPMGGGSVRPTQGLLASSVQRKCAHCEQEEKMKKPLMRKEQSGGGFQAPQGLADSLSTTKGGGSPLPDSTRGFMENAFSADFSRVRIHADGQAVAMSQGIQARAFTHGSDVYFNSGEYRPGSGEGRRLLAHELTHVVQQGNGLQTQSLQRVVEMRPPGRGEASAFDRVQELIDRLNTQSAAIQYSLDVNTLRYNIVDEAALTNFDVQMRGFIDRVEVVPMRLITSAGLVAGGSLLVDSLQLGYLDIDDMLGSDDITFQLQFVHILTERFAVRDYARRLGTPGVGGEWGRAHPIGRQAEALVLQDIFDDDTIRYVYNAWNGGNWVVGFRSTEGYWIFKIFRSGSSALARGETYVQTRDRRRLSVEDFLAERRAGAAVAEPVIQPKLTINAPGDRYEREADAMADRVMRMPMGGGAVRPTQGLLASSVQRKCAHCEQEEKMKKPLMRKAEGGGGFQASPGLASSLSATKGGGSPLPAGTRSFMENVFNTDFSQVRVHTDRQAAEMNRGIQARAFTHGSDVYFNSGEYQPGSGEGKRLLAHELTHVIHQGDKQTTIQRNACGHDSPKGSGCGRLTGSNSLGENMEFPADRFIASSLSRKLSGNWIAQVYSPPNLAKAGKKYGHMDAMKVVERDNLTLEVIEIKSRNNETQASGHVTGGCSIATKEANGYVDALKRIAPNMATVSKGLEKIGGFSQPDCRKLNKESKQKLNEAGVNLANENDMFAWCVLNDIQNRLGRKFTKGFQSVIVKANEDGTANSDYIAFAAPMTCSDKKSGLYVMMFQVNKKGGISYRCEKICNEKKREEREKELEKDISKEVEIQTEAQKTKFQINEPIGEEDNSEDIGVEVGPEGIDTTDIAIWGTGAVAIVTGLHLAAKKAKTIGERKAAMKAAEKIAQELTRRGAPEIARMLDSQNLSKLGTEAYEKLAIERAEKAAQQRLIEEGEEKLAKNLAKKGMKRGAKTAAKNLLKNGAKAIPYIGAAITLFELGNIADAYAKGAEIKFGIDGGEAELAGDTNLDIKGHKPEGGPTTDASLTDTKVEVEMGKMPESSGSLEFSAKKVTIQGKIGADDTEVMVDMKINLENTTIIYKSTGKWKGGKIFLQGSLNIQDSVIEIDIPQGTLMEAPDTAVAQEIKGVKIKITQPGSSGVLIPAPEKTAPEEETAAATKPSDYTPEETKIIHEIAGDKNLMRIYNDIFVAKKGGKISKEVLDRLLAMKDKLAAHPELVEKLIEHTKTGKITDPIKQLVEPMEQMLEEADKKVGELKKETESIPKSTESPSTSVDVDSKSKADEETIAQPATGPSATEKAAATELEFWTVERKTLMTQLPANYEPAPPPNVTILYEVLYLKMNYKVYLVGVFDSKEPNTSNDNYWIANYLVSPPNQIIKSVKGDKPIYFKDIGVSKKIKVTASKPKIGSKPKKKKK